MQPKRHLNHSLVVSVVLSVAALVVAPERTSAQVSLGDPSSENGDYVHTYLPFRQV